MKFAPVLPIRTSRLLLRAFTMADVEAVWDYRSRADVTRFLIDPPMDRQRCAEIVGRRTRQVSFGAEGDKIFLAVEHRPDGAMMGEVTLILRSAKARQGEIGYILHPRHHGHGFATEAAEALLELAFGGAGLHRVYARCHVRNTASFGVMERLGMRREAHLREHGTFKGGWDEEYVYALLEQEWRALKHTGRQGS